MKPERGTCQNMEENKKDCTYAQKTEVPKIREYSGYVSDPIKKRMGFLHA